MDTSVFAQYPNTSRILRVYTERSPEQDFVVFEIFLRAPGQPTTTDPLRGRFVLPSKLMNLPASSGNASESLCLNEIELPIYARRSIVSAFSVDQPSTNPLWILTDRPTGFLAVVPWEELLANDAKAPILRLPHLQLKPFMPKTSLDIAVCHAGGVDDVCLREAIAVVRALPGDLAKIVRIHFFAIDSLIAVLKPRLQDLTNITFYGISDKLAADAPRPPGFEIVNPWLLWMLQQLPKEASFDSVQIIAPCSEFDDQGRVVFASLDQAPPSSPYRSNAREMSEFLECAGAWCATFVSPSMNSSDAGHRLLLDQIAWLCPSPMSLFDLRADMETEDLVASNKFLLGTSSHVPRFIRATVMCHPAGVGANSILADYAGRVVARVPLLTSLLPALGGIQDAVEQIAAGYQMSRYVNRTTLADKLNATFESKQSTPTWISSAQRGLERVLAQAADPLESEDVLTRAVESVADVAKDLANEAEALRKASRQSASVADRLLNRVNLWRER